MTTPPPPSLVVMGVAGCGKSTLAAALARALGRPGVEGDAFHSDASRAKMAQAQGQVQAALKSASVMDPTSELSRFEERVRRQEAQVRGMEEVAASSLDQQFAALDEDEDEAEVQARLAGLKSGS